MLSLLSLREEREILRDPRLKPRLRERERERERERKRVKNFIKIGFEVFVMIYI